MVQDRQIVLSAVGTWNCEQELLFHQFVCGVHTWTYAVCPPPPPVSVGGTLMTVSMTECELVMRHNKVVRDAAVTVHL